MDGFRTFEVSGKTYVVKDINRKQILINAISGERTFIPDANFMGTGMALCGRLINRQTLPEFIEKYNAKKPTKKTSK